MSDICNVIEGDIRKKIREKSFILTPSIVMVKKIAFKKVGLFDESDKVRAVEDWDMWIRISDKYKIGYVPKILVRHRKHRNSLTEKIASSREINGQMVVIEKNHEGFIKRYAQIKRYLRGAIEKVRAVEIKKASNLSKKAIYEFGFDAHSVMIAKRIVRYALSTALQQIKSLKNKII